MCGRNSKKRLKKWQLVTKEILISGDCGMELEVLILNLSLKQDLTSISLTILVDGVKVFTLRQKLDAALLTTASNQSKQKTPMKSSQLMQFLEYSTCKILSQQTQVKVQVLLSKGHHQICLPPTENMTVFTELMMVILFILFTIMKKATHVTQ